MESVLLNILAVFGIIVLLLALYYFIMTYLVDKKSGSSTGAPSFPPKSFMRAVGAQCPSYWVNSPNPSPMGSNYNLCENKFNIPIIKSELNSCQNVNCFDEDSKNRRSFRKIPDWSSVNGRDAIRDQCQWRDCCQTEKNVPYPWIGLGDVCGR